MHNKQGYHNLDDSPNHPTQKHERLGYVNAAHPIIDVSNTLKMSSIFLDALSFAEILRLLKRRKVYLVMQTFEGMVEVVSYSMRARGHRPERRVIILYMMIVA